MLSSICRRAFFQFEVPVHYRARLPRIDGDIGKWSRDYLVPPLVEIEDQDAFADVYWAWHEDGLALAFDVPERRGTLECDPKHWWKQDGVRICVNTREAPDIRRATRFCHFFYALPVGGGSKGRQPLVGLHRMSRAKEPPPVVDTSRVKVAASIQRRGYSLEVLLPAECLHGWDPTEHPRIGIFYKVKDTYHGDQHLTVDDELGWNADPSTWATGVLVR
ncbi:MAG: hypothetical protein ABIG44_04555 [Planctomycetota bacterium]